MKGWGKLLVFVISFALLGVIALPLAAQDQGGQGGIIIDPNPNVGTDVATMNPLLINDTYSAIVGGLLYPTLLGIDPQTGVFAPGARGGLTKSWDVSDDGMTITYHLRDDWNWSDGTPITAQDFIYAYNAIASGETSSPRGSAAAPIVKVKAPDDYTLVITYQTAARNNLDNTNQISPVPAHIFMQQIGTDYAKMDGMDFNRIRPFRRGPFSFADFLRGSRSVWKPTKPIPTPSTATLARPGSSTRMSTT